MLLLLYIINNISRNPLLVVDRSELLLQLVDDVLLLLLELVLEVHLLLLDLRTSSRRREWWDG